ncbi:hypothetical protein CVT25_007174 [Psilocybe cyanescens]|uniref:Uncharacterized protein n=1 Tax=Psilocybe cyanescens TaxID=93625 RepID=A0A409XGH6_PSICY|nr:hypothetical protein CVT25_007174 [Psilocybe cyanescens]
MQALNGTERPANMGIGFFNDAGTKMEPALVWNNVAQLISLILADIFIFFQGFFNDAGTKMEPALVWNNVAKNSTLSVKLTPKLKIYAVSDYKVTELIKADIESPLLFEKNLISLSSFTELTVSIDPGTGEVKITQE